jgi:hypothetical protein
MVRENCSKCREKGEQGMNRELGHLGYRSLVLAQERSLAFILGQGGAIAGKITNVLSRREAQPDLYFIFLFICSTGV